MTKTLVEVENIRIERGMSNFGENVIFITNLDGKKESIMLWEDEWETFKSAVDEMDESMKKEKESL